MDQELDEALENAFLEGDSTFITNLPYETSSYQLLVHVAKKIVDTLSLCSVSLEQNDLIVKNILKILTDFIPILKSDFEQTVFVAECMLRIATFQKVSVQIAKQAVYNLNQLIEGSPVSNWLQNEPILEGYLLILGRKLPTIGDFECQSYIFETLCKIVCDNEDKHNWIQSWFSTDEKTRSMFLNWNLDQFAVESRKILNQMNRREPNPRTYAFAATAVYFGNVQLRKLNNLEFWIDFNYDSESITFFCKDFEHDDQDINEFWETVIITSGDVESYTLQKNRDTKSIELCIILKSSCRNLVPSPCPSESNLVRMIFWIYVDIRSHLKAIFGESKALSNANTADNQDTATVKKARKSSDSDVVKIHAEDCIKKDRRISDSTNLVCLSEDLDETNEKEENKLLENNIHAKGQTNHLEVKPSKEASENEHLSDKDIPNSEPRKKKLKINNGKTGKKVSSTSSLLKRKPDDVDKGIISEESPPKKQRKAAIKAMKKNKNIFEQKEAEYVAKASSENSSNIYLGNEEIEVSKTTPTKPVKKHRLSSIFKSDTETCSSTVSWMGVKHAHLFESPLRNYGNRKNKNETKSISRKKQTHKPNVNSKKKRKSNLSMGSFEIKSKSGLSDLENYELVVETKGNHKKSSHLSHKPITFEKVSKAINAAVKTRTGKQKFQNPLNTETNDANFELEMLDNISEFYNDEELQRDKSKEKDLTNISREDFKSNITDELVTNQKAKDIMKKRHSISKKPSFGRKESLSNSELHQEIVSNKDLLSSSMKKRESTELFTSKVKTKKNKKDTQYLQFESEEDLLAQDLITFDETSQHILSAYTAQNPESPKISGKGQNSSSVSEKLGESHCHSTCLSSKIGILTEQSLSSLGNDETTTKVHHIERFLKGLSDESNSPNSFHHSDESDQAFASVSNKTSKSNKSFRSANDATSENCLSEEIKISKLSSTKNYMDAKKSKHLTSFEESYDKSKDSHERSLQKFSLMDNHEDSGHQEEFLDSCLKEDNHEESFKIKGRKPSKQPSILHVLGIEMDNMTHKLLKTLQKRFYDFNIKISASREKVFAAASALISDENDWQHKDLRKMAKASKFNRINAEKSLKKILLVGQEYFEAEKMHNYRMKRLHQKALKKYVARLKLAGAYAVGALENTAAAKTEVLLQNILKKIEYLV